MPGCFSRCHEGTSLIWYGNIPGELSGNSTTATWVIDDNPAQNFTLKGHEVNATTVYNQKFFETPVYPFGPHKLTVTYNGDNSTTPLVLGKLVIQNGTATPSATGTATPSATSTHTTSSHTPAIVGGVVGGVACLLTVLLILFFLYRRRKQKELTTVVQQPGADVPATQAIPYNPPPRLPTKMSEGYSPNSTIETTTQSLMTSTGRNPSDSRVSDSTVPSPSSLVVLQDSGVRLPLVMPPAYTPD